MKTIESESKVSHFEVGKTYIYDRFNEFTILRRTERSVWVEEDAWWNVPGRGAQYLTKVVRKVIKKDMGDNEYFDSIDGYYIGAQES